MFFTYFDYFCSPNRHFSVFIMYFTSCDIGLKFDRTRATTQNEAANQLRDCSLCTGPFGPYDVSHIPILQKNIAKFADLHTEHKYKGEKSNFLRSRSRICAGSLKIKRNISILFIRLSDFQTHVWWCFFLTKLTALIEPHLTFVVVFLTNVITFLWLEGYP